MNASTRGAADYSGTQRCTGLGVKTPKLSHVISTYLLRVHNLSDRPICTPQLSIANLSASAPIGGSTLRLSRLGDTRVTHEENYG